MAWETPARWAEIGRFYLLACGWSWGVAIAWAALEPGPGLSAALGVVYMLGPALAVLALRVLAGDRTSLGLRPRLRHGWRWWVLAWLLPLPLTLVAAGAYFLAFPADFDPAMGAFSRDLAGSGSGLSAPAAAALQAGIGFALGPVLNALPVLGEELGWRGWLQSRLLHLGPARAFLAAGLAWGVWHAPVIALGHNYGLDHTGAPWAGMVMMIWFCVAAGVVFGWLAWRGGSVWPAVIVHGGINALGGLGMVFAGPGVRPLLGPTPAGLFGCVAVSLVALWVLRRPGVAAERAGQAPGTVRA